MSDHGWHLEILNHDDDTDGWMYAQDFDSKVWYSTATALSMVRRRVHTREVSRHHSKGAKNKKSQDQGSAARAAAASAARSASHGHAEKKHNSGGIPHNLLVNSRELGFVGDF